MKKKRLTGRELADAVEQRIAVSFRDTNLLEQAFTHSSSRVGVSYQRLEFLGDRVLGLLVAEMLYERFPEASEGELALRLNGLVNAEVLAIIADGLALDELIRTGSDVRALASRKQVNMLADVIEALVAVIYLQDGLETVRAFVRVHWEESLKAVSVARADAKTALQEWAHQAARETPRYSVEDRNGPDHDPIFTVVVQVKGYAEGRGQGRSKREAEQAAAIDVLIRESIWKEVEGDK